MQKIWCSFFLVLFGFQSALASEAVYSSGGVAVRGYDVVAYHIKSKVQKGKADYSYHWRNTDWYFSSEENRNKFQASPENYAPQYGGFCAYAASKGSLAPTDPNAWTVYNKKLYLNYSQSVTATWLKNIELNIARADKHWLRLKNTR